MNTAHNFADIAGEVNEKVDESMRTEPPPGEELVARRMLAMLNAIAAELRTIRQLMEEKA